MTCEFLSSLSKKTSNLTAFQFGCMQTYSLPPPQPWRVCGRWCEFGWRRQSSSSPAGCRSARRERSTGCHRCQWKLSRPAGCTGDLEKKTTRMCGKCWEPGIFFSFGENLQVKPEEDAKVHSLNRFWKLQNYIAAAIWKAASWHCSRGQADMKGNAPKSFHV